MECIALCQTPLSAADKAGLLPVVDENLCHPAAAIQDAAAAALHAFARSYLEGASVFRWSTSPRTCSSPLQQSDIQKGHISNLYLKLHPHKAKHTGSLKHCLLICWVTFTIPSWLSVQFLDISTEGHESMAEVYIRGLSSSKSPATRQGSAAALGVLPYHLLMPCWREALAALGRACQVCCLTGLRSANACLHSDCDTSLTQSHG